MSWAPRITGPDLIATLGKSGFSVVRVKGSHHFLRHVDGRSTVVPAHSGETIGPGLFTKSFGIATSLLMNSSTCFKSDRY